MNSRFFFSLSITCLSMSFYPGQVCQARYCAPFNTVVIAASGDPSSETRPNSTTIQDFSPQHSDFHRGWDLVAKASSDKNHKHEKSAKPGAEQQTENSANEPVTNTEPNISSSPSKGDSKTLTPASDTRGSNKSNEAAGKPEGHI